MERRIDEIKLELSEPVPVHFHGGNPEPHLTPLSYKAIETLHADALSIIQRIEAQIPRWISVEERLPEMNTLVLCIGAKGGMFLGERVFQFEKSVYFSVPNARQGRYAKYWMPLPQPPKEET